MNGYRFWAAIAIAVIMLAGCSSSSDKQSKPVLTVSVAPQAALLEEIVGDKYDVNILFDNNSDPETFEPTIEAIADLSRSNVFFSTGVLPIEKEVLEKLTSNAEELRIVDTSTGIPLIRGTHGGETPDPHIWVSPGNLIMIAEQMTAAVIAGDPANEAFYTANFKRLQTRLQKLSGRIAARLADNAGAAFVVWHPSLSYFARDFGLRQIVVESEGKEIGPKEYSSKLKEIAAAKPEVVVAEQAHDPKNAAEIASTLGIPLITIDITGKDITDQLYKIADAIAK